MPECESTFRKHLKVLDFKDSRYVWKSSNFNDPVHVVRHDHAFVQPTAGIMIGQSQPGFLDNAAIVVQFHVLVNDLPQYFLFLLGADGHEIEPRPGVVNARFPSSFALAWVAIHFLT
jgi:hypothetical protein